MRQHEADRERKLQKRAATRRAYRVTNQQSLAVRRALQWIRMWKAQLVFRYEISDLFLRNHPFSELTSDITHLYATERIASECVVDKPVVSVIQFLGWFVGTTISYQTRQLVLAYIQAKQLLRNCHTLLEQTCPYLLR